jgi:hypothetical protein
MMNFPLKSSLEDVFTRLGTIDSRKILFWGEGVGEISSYVAGWMAGEGVDVIVLDGANRFDPYMVSTFAKRASISPEGLLKRIRIARAFTCYQMTALVEEKLISLFKKEERAAPFSPPRVILLGPVTTFLDEDVSEREVRPLFERLLRKVEEMARGGVSFCFFQPNPPSPPFAKGGSGGLVDSKRAYLARRLFQISDLVWKISLDDKVPKMILEKSVDSVIPVKTGIQAKRHGFLLPQE